MKVTVLGGGVNGVTSALLLAVLGHDTTIVSRQRADHAQGTHVPSFASLYPAASVIPHTVDVDDEVGHTEDTQAFFEVLRQAGTCGVRLQMNCELRATETEAPAYAPALHDFRMLPSDGSGDPALPRCPGTDAVYGWTFRTYFAETPTYLPRLYELFEAAGGSVETRTISRADVPTLPGDALVNCLGAGALHVFDDPRADDVRYLRGCLVYADVPDAALHRDTGEVYSYGYQPPLSVYPTADGSPGDLYAYPRTDVWVLGGSRREGRLTNAGEWEGPPIAADTVQIGDLEVPRPVVDVNAEMLRDLYGVDVRNHPLTATYGVRFKRSPLRLERDSHEGRPVVHNYGHGGAGVTLSWSCALRVARHLSPAPASPDRTFGDVDSPDAALLRRLATTAQHLGV